MFQLYTNVPNSHSSLLFHSLDQMFAYIRNEGVTDANFSFIQLGPTVNLDQ